MKKFKVINFSRNWSKIGSFVNPNPYQMTWIYTIDNEKFLVKGGAKDVESWIEENIKIPAIKFITWWHHGEHRQVVHIDNLPEQFRAFCNHKEIEERKEENNYMPKYKKSIILFKTDMFGKSKLIWEKTVRRYPRKFPEEIKNLIRV